MKPLDPLARSLIEDARTADAAPTDVEARVWQSLAQRLHAPLPPSAASVSQTLGSHAASTSLLTGGALKLVIGAVTAGALTLSAYRYASPSQPPAAEQRSTRQTAEPRELSPPHATPDPAHEQRAADNARITEQPGLDSAKHPQPSAAEASSTLGVEAALLTEAQRALAGGDSARALELVTEHARLYPHGKLAQTRDAARVLALCALKRPRAAQKARQQFVKHWPNSPLQDRIQRACATTL